MPAPRRLKRRCWSEAENVELLSAQGEVGNDWERVAARLQDRTGSSTKNQYYRLTTGALADKKRTQTVAAMSAARDSNRGGGSGGGRGRGGGGGRGGQSKRTRPVNTRPDSHSLQQGAEPETHGRAGGFAPPDGHETEGHESEEHNLHKQPEEHEPEEHEPVEHKPAMADPGEPSRGARAAILLHSGLLSRGKCATFHAVAKWRERQLNRRCCRRAFRLQLDRSVPHIHADRSPTLQAAGLHPAVGCMPKITLLFTHSYPGLMDVVFGSGRVFDE